MTRDAIREALTDRQAVICTLYGEAASEPVEGQIAVACVIRNRATHPRWWGSGYKGVCLKRLQFSCFWENNSNSDRVYALAESMLASDDLGSGVMPQLAWIADGVIAGHVIDRSHGADHYLTSRLYGSSEAPAWSRVPHVATVGSHVFFRLEL